MFRKTNKQTKTSEMVPQTFWSHSLKKKERKIKMMCSPVITSHWWLAQHWPVCLCVWNGFCICSMCTSLCACSMLVPSFECECSCVCGSGSKVSAPSYLSSDLFLFMYFPLQADALGTCWGLFRRRRGRETVYLFWCQELSLSKTINTIEGCGV